MDSNLVLAVLTVNMKKNNAFLLLEVLFTLIILVAVVSVFSKLQLKSVLRTLKGREEIERVFLVTKELYRFLLNPPEKEKPVIMEIKNPNIKITTQLFDIDKKSELKDFKDFIRIVRSDGLWESEHQKRSLRAISFILKPEKKAK